MKKKIAFSIRGDSRVPITSRGIFVFVFHARCRNFGSTHRPAIYFQNVSAVQFVTSIRLFVFFFFFQIETTYNNKKKKKLVTPAVFDCETLLKTLKYKNKIKTVPYTVESPPPFEFLQFLRALAEEIIKTFYYRVLTRVLYNRPAITVAETETSSCVLVCRR